jgi:hypothetical protein
VFECPLTELSDVIFIFVDGCVIFISTSADYLGLILSVSTEQIRNVESACVSIPSQLKAVEDGYEWKVQLDATGPFWQGEALRCLFVCLFVCLVCLFVC